MMAAGGGGRRVESPGEGAGPGGGGASSLGGWVGDPQRGFWVKRWGKRWDLEWKQNLEVSGWGRSLVRTERWGGLEHELRKRRGLEVGAGAESHV